jgi:hypothetical protein
MALRQQKLAESMQNQITHPQTHKKRKKECNKGGDRRKKGHFSGALFPESSSPDKGRQFFSLSMHFLARGAFGIQQ